MSIFGSIASAFSSAGNAVADTAKDAGNAIAGAATTTFDFAKAAGTSAALTIGDGGDLMSLGISDVFSGNVQKGFTEMGVGFAEAAGMPGGDQWAKQYEAAIGDATLWSVQQSQARNKQICYTEYAAQVQQNIARLGLQWDDAMAQQLHDNVIALQMIWINPGC